MEALVEKLVEILSTQDFQKFKKNSSQFNKGTISAKEYYICFKSLVPENQFDGLMSELIGVIPKPERKTELETYVASLKTRRGSISFTDEEIFNSTNTDSKGGLFGGDESLFPVIKSPQKKPVQPLQKIEKDVNQRDANPFVTSADELERSRKEKSTEPIVEERAHSPVEVESKPDKTKAPVPEKIEVPDKDRTPVKVNNKPSTSPAKTEPEKMKAKVARKMSEIRPLDVDSCGHFLGGELRVKLEQSKYEVDSGTGQPFTDYVFLIEWKTPDNKLVRWRIQRRYSELRDLYDMIKFEYPYESQLSLPEFPSKTFFRRFTANFVQKRARQLEEWFQQFIANFETAVSDPEVMSFMELDRVVDHVAETLPKSLPAPKPVHPPQGHNINALRPLNAFELDLAELAMGTILAEFNTDKIPNKATRKDMLDYLMELSMKVAASIAAVTNTPSVGSDSLNRLLKIQSDINEVLGVGTLPNSKSPSPKESQQPTPESEVPTKNGDSMVMIPAEFEDKSGKIML
eukprot:TRINITY_DN996_c0_g1_i1.p1 TRINITY_DN996_c0_g1~~TRINITY_DN996_c0_g1_i1.p1  ORF type:complete len:534 (-),score=172.62 TRINITY_DN996_c0_g1_i1:503-2053(-)